MINFFNKLKSFILWNISRNAAKRIARDAFAPNMEFMSVYDAPQPGWLLYNLPHLQEPCWFVTVSQLTPCTLQSTTVVVVSRKSGKILYQGSANDEG